MGGACTLCFLLFLIVLDIEGSEANMLCPSEDMLVKASPMRAREDNDEFAASDLILAKQAYTAGFVGLDGWLCSFTSLNMVTLEFRIVLWTRALQFFTSHFQDEISLHRLSMRYAAYTWLLSSANLSPPQLVHMVKGMRALHRINVEQKQCYNTEAD